MGIRPEIAAMAGMMQQWRRQLHANPELASEERETADFVAGLLTSWGIDVHRGMAGTGVIGTLKSGTSARAVGLRADMDALPVGEQNTFEHRSRHAGRMHACGHDGHTAMLLGGARYLAETRNFDGCVHFIFQPAEETLSGASAMLREGLFERFPMDAIYGMHNFPMIPEGEIGVRSGPIMASADFFRVAILGKGGHGAWPHLGIDAIGVASQIVMSFNQIAARTIDPMESAVISVTQFHAGHSNNVIPELVELGGTTRTFSPAVRDAIESRMRQACDGIAAAHGATVKFEYDRLCPPTINHPQEAQFSAQVAERVVGTERVRRNEPPVMAAEDFAWMLASKRGSYVLIGNGPEHQGGCMLHNPNYDFNDRILPIGASYWVELAESALTHA